MCCFGLVAAEMLFDAFPDMREGHRLVAGLRWCDASLWRVLRGDWLDAIFISDLAN